MVVVSQLEAPARVFPLGTQRDSGQKRISVAGLRLLSLESPLARLALGWLPSTDINVP